MELKRILIRIIVLIHVTTIIECNFSSLKHQDLSCKQSDKTLLNPIDYIPNYDKMDKLVKDCIKCYCVDKIVECSYTNEKCSATPPTIENIKLNSIGLPMKEIPNSKQKSDKPQQQQPPISSTPTIKFSTPSLSKLFSTTTRAPSLSLRTISSRIPLGPKPTKYDDSNDIDYEQFEKEVRIVHGYKEEDSTTTTQELTTTEPITEEESTTTEQPTTIITDEQPSTTTTTTTTTPEPKIKKNSPSKILSKTTTSTTSSIPLIKESTTTTTTELPLMDELQIADLKKEFSNEEKLKFKQLISNSRFFKSHDLHDNYQDLNYLNHNSLNEPKVGYSHQLQENNNIKDNLQLFVLATISFMALMTIINIISFLIFGCRQLRKKDCTTSTTTKAISPNSNLPDTLFSTQTFPRSFLKTGSDIQYYV